MAQVVSKPQSQQIRSTQTHDGSCNRNGKRIMTPILARFLIDFVPPPSSPSIPALAPPLTTVVIKRRTDDEIETGWSAPVESVRVEKEKNEDKEDSSVTWWDGSGRVGGSETEDNNEPRISSCPYGDGDDWASQVKSNEGFHSSEWSEDSDSGSGGREYEGVVPEWPEPDDDGFKDGEWDEAKEWGGWGSEYIPTQDEEGRINGMVVEYDEKFGPPITLQEYLFFDPTKTKFDWELLGLELEDKYRGGAGWDVKLDENRELRKRGLKDWRFARAKSWIFNGGDFKEDGFDLPSTLHEMREVVWNWPDISKLATSGNTFLLPPPPISHPNRDHSPRTIDDSHRILQTPSFSSQGSGHRVLVDENIDALKELWKQGMIEEIKEFCREKFWELEELEEEGMGGSYGDFKSADEGTKNVKSA